MTLDCPTKEQFSYQVWWQWLTFSALLPIKYTAAHGQSNLRKRTRSSTLKYKLISNLHVKSRILSQILFDFLLHLAQGEPKCRAERRL